jgi:hypothetical protein
VAARLRSSSDDASSDDARPSTSASAPLPSPQLEASANSARAMQPLNGKLACRRRRLDRSTFELRACCAGELKLKAGHMLR